MLNTIDRCTLALDAIRRLPRMAVKRANVEQWHFERMQHHKLYVSEHGEDLPEIRDWRWDDASTDEPSSS